MARTKTTKTKGRNTARKSVGGPAKRGVLGPPGLLCSNSAKSRSRSAASSTVASTTEHSPAPDSMDVDTGLDKGGGGGQLDLNDDDWCALCSDGHPMLLNCDNCGAAHCAECIPSLSRPSLEELQNYTFRCICCAKRGTVYHGFYDDKGEPIYPGGIEVTAHNIGASFRNRLRTPRLLIIEFVLRELEESGTAGQMLHLSLKPNYIKEKKRSLYHVKVLFDLKNSRAISRHQSTVLSHLEKIKGSGWDYDHAVVIVHTHSDDTRGDLFYTSKDDTEGGPLATPIDSFFENILGGKMKAYLKTMKFSALFLLACGSVVRNSDALAGLKMVASDFGFTDTFAFGAKKVIGHFVTIWMIKYADMVIVTGMNSRSCISSLLYLSDIGRHTSILFIHKKKPAKKGSPGGKAVEKGPPKGKAAEVPPILLVEKYIWEHKKQRPNTHTFPLTCPVCHLVQPWKKPGAFWNKEGTGFTLTCTGGAGGCPGSVEIEARPSSTDLESPYVGKWYLCDKYY